MRFYALVALGMLGVMVLPSVVLANASLLQAAALTVAHVVSVLMVLAAVMAVVLWYSQPS